MDVAWKEGFAFIRSAFLIIFVSSYLDAYVYYSGAESECGSFQIPGDEQAIVYRDHTAYRKANGY